jgi:hypothetical protein
LKSTLTENTLPSQYKKMTTTTGFNKGTHVNEVVQDLQLESGLEVWELLSAVI